MALHFEYCERSYYLPARPYKEILRYAFNFIITFRYEAFTFEYVTGISFILRRLSFHEYYESIGPR